MPKPLVSAFLAIRWIYTGLAVLFVVGCVILMFATSAPESLREFFLDHVAIVGLLAVALEGRTVVHPSKPCSEWILTRQRCFLVFAAKFRRESR